MQKIIAILELMRTKNCLMAGIAVIIGFAIASQEIHYNMFLAFLTAFFICGAGQTINDFFDYNIDKKINKEKPLPSKRISKKETVFVSIIFFGIGLIISLFINPTAFFIALLFAFLLTIYSSVFYKKKYFGNIIVALGTAITFIFGASATGKIPLIILFFFVTAFFANMAREITKDFEDIKKDNGFKKTLPMISKKIGKQFVLFYYFSSIILAFVTGIIFSLNIFYFILIFVTMIIFAIAIKSLEKKDFKKSQSFSKKGMIVSLIAFLTSILK